MLKSQFMIVASKLSSILIPSQCSDGKGKRSEIEVDVETKSKAEPSEYLSMTKAALHIFKGNVGAGIFLLPTFYEGTGYALGVLILVVLAYIMLDCSLALLRAKTIINRAHIQTYPAVVDAILGVSARRFTDMAILFTQFGYCVFYIQYTSLLYASLFPMKHMYASMIVLCVLLVTPLTCMSHNLSFLAVASLIAATFVVIILVVSTSVELSEFHNKGIADSATAAKFTSGILSFIAGHVFALEGICVILPIENSVAPDKRKHFYRLLKFCLLFIVAVYIFFGVLGYLSYGDQLTSSVIFALQNRQSKLILQCLLGLSLIMSYPIQYVPAIEIIDRITVINMANKRVTALALRVALNTLFGLAAFHIGENTINSFASFIGASVGMHLMMTIPALLALQLNSVVGEDDRRAIAHANAVNAAPPIAATLTTAVSITQSYLPPAGSSALSIQDSLSTEQEHCILAALSRKRNTINAQNATLSNDKDTKSYNDIFKALSETPWSITNRGQKLTLRRLRWIVYIVLSQLLWASNMYLTLMSMLHSNTPPIPVVNESTSLLQPVNGSVIATTTP